MFSKLNNSRTPIAPIAPIARTSSPPQSDETLQQQQPRAAADAVAQAGESDTNTNTNNLQRSRRVRGRRRLKSALYLAYWSAAVAAVLLLLSCPLPLPTASAFATANRQSCLSQRKSEWIERSVQYYSGVMRKNVVVGGGSGATKPLPKTTMDSATVSSASEVSPIIAGEKIEGGARSVALADLDDKDFIGLATKHYYARYLVKNGKWDFAEKIYRRIIDELSTDEDDCDHTKLAVSTLLLALHVQRTGDIKATRAVFINFFRRVALTSDEDENGEGEVKCTCSAKVLQAYALFEMKNGHSAKSLEILRRAVRMDEKLSPVLGWKQFRDAAAGREYSPTFSFRKHDWRREEGSLKERMARLSP